MVDIVELLRDEAVKVAIERAGGREVSSKDATGSVIWQAADAIEALRQVAPTPPPTLNVQVKSLEWRGLEAHSSVGLYRVQRLGDKWEPLHLGAYMLPKIHGVVAALDTLEEAQAVAQADYESRIRSAVVVPTPPVSTEVRK